MEVRTKVLSERKHYSLALMPLKELSDALDALARGEGLNLLPETSS